MKVTGYLYLGVGLLILAHLAYTVESKHDPLQGNYFTSGVVLASDGKVLDYSIRLQADDENLFHYGLISGVSTEFVMRFVSGLFGSARMVTEGVVDKLPAEKILGLERDIVFSYSYVGKASSKLTMYRLNVESGSQCYYIRELSIVRCLGVERIRVVN
jgi:hypothetical protein